MADLKSNDPVEKLIFEKGLRISHARCQKSNNVMIIVLNNGQAIKVTVSHFNGLKNASQEELINYN